MPIVIAGQLAGPLGLVPTVFWYSALTVLVALTSLGAQLRLGRSMVGSACRVDCVAEHA